MVRPEIQALRAIAVLLVVVYHLWPAVVPGGYVGVDVFFVISGFLITAHLLREVEREGRVSLARFWARRARRLLPAALLTLAVCLVATIALVPQLHWERFLSEIAASAAYVQNWQLAGDAVDYLAADDQPTAVRHFWSLSAEEQFYVLWPVLVLLAVFAARGHAAGARRVAIAVALGAVTAASLAYSIVETAASPESAYFLTPARAWEFGAGGLLALFAARPPSTLQATPGARAALSWAGLAAISAAGFAYGDGTPFPGWAALLPVLGTLAVIAAGAPASRWAPTPLLRLRAGQFVGGISYSVYLWHWPLLVLAPFAVSAGATQTRVAVLALTILVAWGATRLVEDPIRNGAFLAARPPRRTFAWAGAATALLAALLVGANAHLDGQVRAAERASADVLTDRPPCFGAAARDPARDCDNPDLRGTVVPSPLVAQDEHNESCRRKRRDGPITACAFGVAPERATRRVALVGDSHAAHWRAALERVATAERWHGFSITRTSCPFSEAGRGDLSVRARARCEEWNDRLPRWLAERERIDTVFVVANTGGSVDVPRGQTLREAQRAGYRDAWRGLPDSVRHVVVIRDTPKLRFRTLGCVDEALATGRRAASACAIPRRTALEADPAEIEARRRSSDRVEAIDLNGVLCSRRLCPPVIGGALVYKDEHHLTRVFSATLGRIVRRRVERVVDQRPRSSQRPTARATARLR